MAVYPFGEYTTSRQDQPFIIVNKPKPLGNLAHVVETLLQLSIIAIGIVVIVYATMNWSGFLTPLLSAIVIGLMLSPAVSALENHSVPSLVAVAVLVLTVCAIVFLAANLLWQPITTGIDQIPALVRALEGQIESFARAFESVTGVEQSTSDTTSAATTNSNPDAVQNIEIDQNTVLGSLLVFAPRRSAR